MLRFLFATSVLLVAACTAGAGATTAPTLAPATPAPATAAPATAAAGATVSLASGGYFTGPNGMTLYTFDKDTLGTSSCAGDCASNWPALTVTSASGITVGTGLNAADFGTATGDGGTLQVAFKQIPLYYFAGDQAVGDTNGDGVGGVWHLATVTSTLPPPAASAGASAAPSGAPASCGPDDPYCSPSTQAPASMGAESQVNTSADGAFLVDAAGMSLYTFDNDTPGVSSCSDSCAENWPALTAAEEDEPPTVGDGVTGVIAVIERDDGTYQVTYNDLPLYYFAGDAAPGDVNGDGVGDVWHLAAP
jgi:predicted lipoprotein with Yx(FWY)xxD motif